MPQPAGWALAWIISISFCGRASCKLRRSTNDGTFRFRRLKNACMNENNVRRSSMIDRLLVSKKDAALMLSVSVRTVENLIAVKRLVARKLGRRTLIPRSSIEQLAKRDTPSPAIEAAEM